MALQLERETAVLGDLFEHVIEEADAGADRARTLARQIDLDRNVGLPGLALDARAPRLRGDAPRDRRPGLIRAAVLQHLDARDPRINRAG